MKNLRLFCLFVFVICVAQLSLFAQNEPFGVYTNDYYASGGGVAFDFYPSGYSDGWYWGYTQGKHEFSSHEMLSGEWAAAVYYTGIHNNKANWLANSYSYPSFPTGTIFAEDPSYTVSYDYRAAQSRVYDPNIEIAIDYRLVDLGEGNSVAIPFKASNGNASFVQSERYLLFQTYVLRNVSESNVTDLRFFQMLHGHPIGLNTDSYPANSTYTDANYPNILKDPCNPARSFHYAITQWNSTIDQTGHYDWESFSSTIAPDWIDNGLFEGHGSTEPTTGTYANIENLSLNGDPNIYNDEATGAMGWRLGTLEPDESTSITVAVMLGCGTVTVVQCPFTITKTDDVGTGSRIPGDYVTYTINWNYSGTNLGPIHATIVDELPAQIDILDVTAYNGGSYDLITGTVTWDLGTVSPGASGSVSVKIKISEDAVSGGTITNTAKLTTAEMGFISATKQTNIGCWGTVKNINKNKWYCDIQSAINDANANSEIDVWPGTYSGQFLISSKTIAIKAVDANANRTNIRLTSRTANVDYGFKFENSNNCAISGFTIQNGWIGIWAKDSNELIISDCTLLSNGTGISNYSSTGYPPVNLYKQLTVKSCKINGWTSAAYDGIIGYGISFVGKTMISDCWISGNVNNGIVAGGGIIKNNMVSYNKGDGISSTGNTVLQNNIIYGTPNLGYSGIYISSPLTGAQISNITIGDNLRTGITVVGTGTIPIRNSIVWATTPFAATNYDVQYCCVKNGYSGSTNISSDPCFISTTKKDFRIKAASLCRDKGSNTYVQTGDEDIDYEQRIWSPDGTTQTVDIGADEWLEKSTDINTDGITNLVDYAIFAKAWRTVPGSSAWNSFCDLYPDGVVNWIDMGIFAGDWLWRAGYTISQEEIFGFPNVDPNDPNDPNEGEEMMMSSGGEELQSMSLDSMAVSESESLDSQATEETKTAEDFMWDIWNSSRELRNSMDQAEWHEFLQVIKQAEQEAKTKRSGT